MPKHVTRASWCCAIALIATSAHAQTNDGDVFGFSPKPYVRAAVGALKLNSPTATGTAMDLNGSGSKAAAHVAAGVQLNRYFGVEAAWYQLPGTTLQTATGDARYDGSVLAASVTGSLPVTGALDAVARVGMGRSSVNVNVPATNYSSDSHRNLVTWGLGARYRLTPSVSLTFDYDNLGAVGKYEFGNDLKATVLSVGVQFKF